MNIELSLEALRKRSLFIATPMYGGLCSFGYLQSCLGLANRCWNLQISTRFQQIPGDSLITRARNDLLDEFLRAGDTHLCFIDADITFEPMDVLCLLALDKDISAGPVPKKRITWDRVMDAAQHQRVTAPADLAHAAALDFAFTSMPGDDVPLDRPVQVVYAGTAFMMISRAAVLRMIDAYPETRCYTAPLGGPAREIHALFECVIDPETKFYLSEDYGFCQRARAIGLQVWLAPWMRLQHSGPYIYDGTVESLAILEQTRRAHAQPVSRQQRRAQERAAAKQSAQKPLTDPSRVFA